MPSEQLEDIEYEENELGHLLKNVNPQAAAAIENPPPPPDVGTWVVFKGRAGFSRMHRTEFAALVLGTDPNTGLQSLMVVMEPEDMMMETNVPFCSHNQEHFCWRYRRPTAGEIEAGNDLAKRVAAIEDHLREETIGLDLEALNIRLEAAEQVLMGPEVDDLEKRIATLEANWAIVQPLLVNQKATKGK